MNEKKTRFLPFGEIWFLVIVLSILVCAPNPVVAQTAALTVTIITPNENETFYSSSSTLLYSIAIKGWVATQHPEPSLVRVRIDILRDGIVTGSATTRLDSTSAFLFDVTVDPTAPRGEFTIAEVENGCENCHHLADLALPSGKIVLRVTAIEPSGRQATAERRIIVDCSTYTNVPVRVVRAEQLEQSIANVPVSGAARLYMWRTRHQTSLTNDAGETFVHVEMLSHSPTRYVFRVEPSVVDGKLIQSIEPITVTLVPGASLSAPITLRVSSRAGEIIGTTNVAIKPIAVRAIRLTDGASYATQTTATSTFAFENLPIAQYLILADERALAEQGFASTPQTIDLAASPTTTMTLPLVATARGNIISGTVRDAKGARLPFAWIALEHAEITRGAAPHTGEFWLSDAPQRNAKFTLVASAPGYYHQAQVVDGTTTANFALTRRPETRSIVWGSGEIIAPPESQVRVEPQNIALEYGWLWGSGDGALTLRVADTTISLPAGKFAVEYFPDRDVAWFYLIEGAATVRAKNETTLRAGEMLALANARLTPAPLNANVIAALHPTNISPLAPTWEPSLDARARDQLAQMGISVAQATTFVTYSIIVLILILSPLSAGIWWWRQRRAR
ncbi:MAG: carboxypeptidase regulatory-like domain-containing protein [Chloroflexi bacterium]|nr:carboxypeptidase regulatory-like domain-containing protein [Chloroflexota bacterium]